MTQTLTTERLKDLTLHHSKLIFPASHEEAAAMARELLANREAQPVGYIMPDDVEHLKSGDVVVVGPNNSYCKFPLYTAPPAPAVQSVVDWRLDESTGAKILMYKDCSVIEDQQAEYVLSLIQAAAPEGGNG